MDFVRWNKKKMDNIDFYENINELCLWPLNSWIENE